MRDFPMKDPGPASADRDSRLVRAATTLAEADLEEATTEYMAVTGGAVSAVVFVTVFLLLSLTLTVTVGFTAGATALAVVLAGVPFGWRACRTMMRARATMRRLEKEVLELADGDAS